MHELLKVVVMTRGRTGSSAITQELGQAPGCYSEQEVFSLEPGLEFYDFPPFEAWRAERPAADEAAQAEAYLDALEGYARGKGCRALFWKLLSSHLDQKPYLGEILRRRDYRVIYLTRALGRQVVSGMVAVQRGVYNTYNDLRDTRRYRIDIVSLRDVLTRERYGVSRDEGLRYKYRFRSLEVRYEDYLENREAFFARIYADLGLPVALPSPSRYVVMIPDLTATVENLDEVEAAIDDLGERL